VFVQLGFSGRILVSFMVFSGLQFTFLILSGFGGLFGFFRSCIEIIVKSMTLKVKKKGRVGYPTEFSV
jgi:hypothetical protein